MPNVKTEGQTAGNMGYNSWQKNTELADDAVVTINHGSDDKYLRIVKAVNAADGTIVPHNISASAGVTVTFVSATQTTVKNVTGGVANLIVTVFIPS